jgi:DNA polymerase III subunit gamma/tau
MNPNLSIDNIIGQEIPLQYIKRYIQDSSKIPPLLIFHGPSGVGKWTLAERFVYHVLCKKGNGCSNCESCRLFMQNEHPDFIQFPSGKKILIGSDDEKKTDEYSVRWLLSKRIYYTPHLSQFRIILIPDATLFTDEAESALLKTLEEPPLHTKFIFLTEDLYKLKQTIISRGTCIPFQYLSQESINKINTTGEIIYKYFGGSLSPVKAPTEVLQLIESQAVESINDNIRLLEFENWIKSYKDSHPEWEKDFSNSHFIDAVLLVLLYVYESSDLPNKHYYQEKILEGKEYLYKDITNLENFIISRLFMQLAKDI